MPPAFTVTIGRPVRGDTACSACATRLFPVPFSPVIRTLASRDRRARSSRAPVSWPRIRRESASAVSLQCLIRRFQLPTAPVARPSSVWCGRSRGGAHSPTVSARSRERPPHRYDRHIDRAPAVGRRPATTHRRWDSLRELGALFPRGRIARVVQVHRDHVVVLELERRRSCWGDAAVSITAPASATTAALR
jgi:hypothetical protein